MTKPTPQRPLRWRALWRVWALLLGVGIVATCDTLKQPEGTQATVSIAFQGDTVLMVGTNFSPTIMVTQDGTPVPVPRLKFESSDESIIFTGSLHDSIHVKKRGVATVTISLVGSALGDNPPSTTQVVVAVAASAKIAPLGHPLGKLFDTVALAAQALDVNGDSIPGASFAWASSDTAVANVTPAGQVISHKNGTATITAVIDKDTATTAVTVQQVLFQYAFNVPALTFASITQTFPLVATPQDSGSNAIPGSPVPAWSSANQAIARVNAQGVVTAVGPNGGAPGTRVTATGLNGVTDTLHVDVIQSAKTVSILLAPKTLLIDAVNTDTTLLATASDTLNQTVLDNNIVWTSRNSGVVLITTASGQTGKMQSRGLGSTYIIAQEGAGIDSVPVTVTNDPAGLKADSTSISITSVGDTSRLGTHPVNSRGVLLGSLPVTWSVADPSVAKVVVDPGVVGGGIVVGLGIGNTTITATLAANTNFRATLPVVVSNSPAQIDIIPTAATLQAIGDTAFPQVDIRNKSGAQLARTSATWTSNDNNVATVGPDGTITAVGPGTAIIKATSPVAAQINDIITITVTNAPVSVTLNRTNDTLVAPGKTLSYSAVILNKNGAQIINPVFPLRWTSTNTAAATVGADGLATAVAIGTTMIIAADSGSQGLKADTSILVVRNVPQTITVSPSPATLAAIASTQQLTATVKNAFDLPIGGLTLTYSSADNSVATVSAAGLVTGAGIGSTTITVATQAASGAVISTTVPVNVANAPTVVDITSADTTLASIGDSYSPGVNFRNSVGNALPRDAVTWTTTNGAVATVSATGVVVATGAGAATIRATSPGSAVTDAIVVTVTNAPVSLTVQPAGPVTLSAIGAAINFVATVKNQAGAVIVSPSPAVSWSSNSGAVTVVAGTGVATAASTGSAIITATAGAATGSATVNVAPAPSAVRSTITAGVSTLTANGSSSTTITIQAKDSLGVNLTVGGAAISMGLAGTGTLGSVTDHADGTYTAALTAPAALGTGTVSATINGVAVSSGNALVAYVAGPATKYLVTSSSSTPTAGTTVTITAQLADAFNNPVATSGKTVTWSSTAGGSFGSPTSLTNASGFATVSFTTSTSAPITHLVTATDNTALTGTSTGILTVSAAAADYLVTPSTVSPAAGSDVTVTAQLRDAAGNAVAMAGQTVTWSKLDPNGSFSSPTSLTNAGGLATITFHSHTVSGTATTVSATTASLSVTGTSATITTVPGTASAGTTTIGVSLGAVAAGTPVTVTVTARDANGNLLTSSGGAVALATSLGSLGTVVDNANGTYTATLSNPATGVATVSGTIGGVAITSGNPTVTVNPGAVSAAQSTATVPAGSVGALSTVVIRERDAFGNARTANTGGLTVAAQVSGANVAPAAVVSNGDGTYNATYTPALAGTDAITITFNASPISGSPFSSVVSSGVVSGFLVETQGGGAIPSQASGTPFNIRVTARDAGDNLVTTFTGTVDLSST
ncbi:MAG TPA: invasin domain 3-containing protein, partial [Gemmatimonadales bacterium]